MIEKGLQFLEKHPIVRFATILSVFVGLFIAFKPFILRNLNLGGTQKSISSNSEYKDYFIPTHYVCLDSNEFVSIRNRALTNDEFMETDIQSAEGKVIDANTIIGQLEHCSRIKLLLMVNSNIMMQYWDGEKLIIGYISDETELTLIKPQSDNPYGLGNGKLLVCSVIPGENFNIYVDDKYEGTIAQSFDDKKNCESPTESDLQLTIKAGEHVVKIVYSDGKLFSSKHVSLYEKDCFMVKVN